MILESESGLGLILLIWMTEKVDPTYHATSSQPFFAVATAKVRPIFLPTPSPSLDHLSLFFVAGSPVRHLFFFFRLVCCVELHPNRGVAWLR